jgi:hypothetical protein
VEKSPVWFKITAVVALLWNLLGCLAFAGDLMLTADDVAKLPEAHQAMYAARPGWSVVATAVAVVGGALGCIALLMKSKWAYALFALSLIGILVQDYAMFVLIDGAALAGSVAVILQGIVLLVGVLLVLLSRRAIARNWIA